MSRARAIPRTGGRTVRETEGPAASLPLDRSVGYQVRATHRLFQRAIQARIEPHGVTLGMWYFLRVLWVQDGLTQSELSQSIGIMEPTTLSATRDMERSGFVRRVRNVDDRRKINIYLTEEGRALQDRLLPLAVEVVQGGLHRTSSATHRILRRHGIVGWMIAAPSAFFPNSRATAQDAPLVRPTNRTSAGRPARARLYPRHPRSFALRGVPCRAWPKPSTATATASAARMPSTPADMIPPA